MMFDINAAGVLLWLSGIGMGYVLAVMLRLDQIESEEEAAARYGYRPAPSETFEHVDSNHE